MAVSVLLAMVSVKAGPLIAVPVALGRGGIPKNIEAEIVTVQENQGKGDGEDYLTFSADVSFSDFDYPYVPQESEQFKKPDEICEADPNENEILDSDDGDDENQSKSNKSVHGVEEEDNSKQGKGKDRLSIGSVFESIFKSVFKELLNALSFIERLVKA